MIYSFICPVPCNREIQVHAEHDDDAAIELITAGALCCRNTKYRCHCEKARKDMSPISEEKLNQIVRVCMQHKEYEKREDYNSISTPVNKRHYASTFGGA